MTHTSDQAHHARAALVALLTYWDELAFLERALGFDVDHDLLDQFAAGCDAADGLVTDAQISRLLDELKKLEDRS